MSIQICLRGFLLAYYSDYSILFLVIVKKGQNKWLDNVCLKFWVLLISIDKLPRHLACFGGQMPPLSFMFKTPTPLKYSEQHILGTNTGVMCLPFFFSSSSADHREAQSYFTLCSALLPSPDTHTRHPPGPSSDALGCSVWGSPAFPEYNFKL